MNVLVPALAWMLAAQGAADAPAEALADCKRLHAEFAVDAMERVCRAVSDDPSRDVASRIFALRLLAGAQLLKGDERAAEMVLVRMFTFDIDASPAPEDGPDFRRVLARAKQRVVDEGVLDVTLVRDGDVVRSVLVRDPLGRVARVEVQGARGSKQLARFDEKPGLATFVVPDDVAREATGAEVVLVGWTNKPLRRIALVEAAPVPAPAPAPASASASPSAASVAEQRSVVVPWTLIVAGGAVASAGLLVTAATVTDSNASEPCDASPDGCVPNRPLMFGVYSREARADFFAHYTAWLSAGMFTMLLGGVLVAGGGALLANE